MQPDTLALVSARDDDGQAVFSTQLVAGPAYLVIATLVGMIELVVGEADCIENQIIVNISLIDMGGKYKLVLATQYFFSSCIPISWASSANAHCNGFPSPIRHLHFPGSVPEDGTVFRR